MQKNIVATTIALAALAIPVSAWARCPLPESAGRYKKYTGTVQHTIEHKGSIYTLWEYRGYTPDGSIGALSPVIIQEHKKRCTVVYDSMGDDVSWSWGIPRPVAIAFARKEIEVSIKRLGRSKVQARLANPTNETMQPEWAEAYKLLGFKLKPGQKIYPWIKK